MIILETERLLIRQFEFSDLDKLIEIRTNPAVYKYLGGIERQNPEALAKRLQFYIDCYEKYGFGMCAMIWKKSGEMIGASGIQPLEETGEIEVGYSLSPDYWRKGIGYECAKVWLEFGFKEKGLERIVAIADKENKGSWRIMEKCGMRYEKTDKFYGFDCVLYAISKDEFLSLDK